MFAKRSYLVVLLVFLAAMLGACAPATPTPAAPPASAAQTTLAPTQAPTAAAKAQELILATTTSTEDSGLLKVILPDFEKQAGVKVNVIAVGTGQSIKLGQDGNADVVLVHARAQEDAFMADGHGIRREDVMYNDFVIVGTDEDPAKIKGLKDAAEALKKIAAAQATFVSRGDNSGTHVKEKDIWKKAGIEPSGNWYVSAGQGMGAVLTMANEQKAYTLSDRATYLALTLKGTELKIMVEGDPALFNPYGVMVVNPAKGAHIKADLANKFVDWLVSESTQAKIAKFGVEQFGSPLFTPDSVAWRKRQPATSQPSVIGVPANAALKITGLVAQSVGWTAEQLGSMDKVKVEYTSSKGEKQTYEGIPLQQLLVVQAGIKDTAATIELVASDGFTAQVPWTDLKACSDCIVVVQTGGDLRSVMPGFPGNAQVKSLVEIRVK